MAVGGRKGFTALKKKWKPCLTKEGFHCLPRRFLVE
jgi:hypothetical protein